MSPPLCEGVAPLTARLEPWQRDLLARPELLQELLERHGSPLNLIDPGPMATNLGELRAAAEGHGLELGCYFARKANKAVGLVDRALALGAGLDVASAAELEQSLARGADPGRVVLTAAVKPRALLELAVDSGVAVVVDNADELALLSEIAAGRDAEVPVALRLGVTAAGPGRLPTRFGATAEELLGRLEREWGPGGRARGALRLEGLHFHVDGYADDDRARGLRDALRLADRLAAGGGTLRFVDIGGGVPMRYLPSAQQWESFWARHHEALAGREPPLTYLGHGLGLRFEHGRVVGEPNVYPAAQELVRGEWLDRILAAPAGVGAEGETIAAGLRRRGLELRCEPGRALLDGCGMTLARVEFRKRTAAGEPLVGLAMNRTQSRTSADDSMLDPLLVRGPRSGRASEPMDGYLVGAYCIERELLSWRRLRFGAGVAVGDVVAFPNTAGYFMHILESSSHQMPLARNLLIDDGEPTVLDPIDEWGEA